jgi:hypothetical protein
MAYEFRATTQYLARAAMERRLVTYGELATEFGGTALGWGRPLTDITARLHKHGLPLLPCIVVTKGADLPSLDADIYDRLGLSTDEQIRREQQRCFEYNWSESRLLTPAKSMK